MHLSEYTLIGWCIQSRNYVSNFTKLAFLSEFTAMFACRNMLFVQQPGWIGKALLSLLKIERYFNIIFLTLPPSPLISFIGFELCTQHEQQQGDIIKCRTTWCLKMNIKTIPAPPVTLACCFNSRSFLWFSLAVCERLEALTFMEGVPINPLSSQALLKLSVLQALIIYHRV